MKYDNIVKGTFISRPNRFIAYVEIDGKEEICHVKNTGRCKELLVKGCRVILEYCPKTQRKTKYDLIAVYKGDMLINMDSLAPNKVAGEYLRQLYPNGIVKAEVTYKESRFDYYVEVNDRKMFIEVKGVTLENDGVVMFPDAPTLRGLKHINELITSLDDGYEASILFIIQLAGAKYFTPNYLTHPEFGEGLKRAVNAGVNVLAIECDVKENSLTYSKAVNVIL